jgi:hypothetical protein
MADVNEFPNTHTEAPKRRWKLLSDILFKPRWAFKQLAAIQNHAWGIPMLLLTALIILSALAGGPARYQNTVMNLNQPPEDFIYWTPEQQNQFNEGQMALQGPLFTVVFPMISSLAGLWLGWFLLASVLHLLMTLKGSRQSREVFFNYSAWAAVPFAIRSLVQTVSFLATNQIIASPGLSGLISQGAVGWQPYLRLVLGMVDLYAIWVFILLLVGSPIVSGLKPGKAITTTLIACLIFTVLALIPGVIRLQLGGLGTVRPFIFF